LVLGRLLGSRLRAKIIGWFFTHTDERYFTRQLTALLGEESSNLSKELKRLAGMGILSLQQEGQQKYYQANPDCPIFAELRGIATKTAAAGDVLGGALAQLRGKIRAAFVYGSFARGEETARSDVDVMVIGKTTFAEVVDALHPAQEKLGREVNPTVYSLDEFRSKLAAKHHFLTTVFGASKIFLIGDEHELERLAKE
jgi:predicted nucleotidyltransferase